MTITDKSSSSRMRPGFASMQGMADPPQRTQKHHPAGRKISAARNNPVALLTAQSLTQRLSGLSSLRDSMGQAIANVRSAIAGIARIGALISATRRAAAAAEVATHAEVRSSREEQVDALLSQIDTCARGSGPRGSNLLNGDTLTLALNESGTSTLTIAGFMATSTGLGIAAAATGLDAAVTTLRRNAVRLSASLDIITIRRDFTAEMVKTLTAGSARSTHAGRNEEGANMLLLQTRLEPGISASGLSARGGRSLLRLF